MSVDEFGFVPTRGNVASAPLPRTAGEQHMNLSFPQKDVLEKQHLLATEITGQVAEAYAELVRQGKDPEKHLPKAVAARLVQLHYFTVVGTKEIFKDFHASIDIVGWKSSFAQAVAIVFAWDMGSDRLDELDEFAPTLLFPRSPLIKILVDVNAPRELNAPETLGNAYIFGLVSPKAQPTRVAVPAVELDEEPF